MKKGQRNPKRGYSQKKGSSQRREFERESNDKRMSTHVKDKRLSPLNDFSWYNNNPLLTEAASRIPFPYRPGMDVVMSVSGRNPQYKIPGVFRIKWLPSISQSSEATDPASIAAKEVYAKVREAFSGSIDADPPDFVIYFLALDSIFSYIATLKRIYRILTTYTPQNYEIPDRLLAALDVPTELAENLRKNKAQLWQYINELVGMTRKFRCPHVFDIFNRHYWMNDNVYMDAPTANSQMYVFTQSDYYVFGLLNTPDGVPAGGLITTPNPFSKTATVDTLFEYGVTMINALAGSDDAYTISGYLMRAYEGSDVFTVDEIQNDETFEPVYVPEVLAQIENATNISGFSVWVNTSNNISQDPKTNALICNPKVTPLSGVTGVVSPSISIRSDMPTVEEVVEATRDRKSVV